MYTQFKYSLILDLNANYPGLYILTHLSQRHTFLLYVYAALLRLRIPFNEYSALAVKKLLLKKKRLL